MPTPFMHLDVAEAMRRRAAALGDAALLQMISAHWPAFYLGHVAPDVNAISELSRDASHFYHLPPVPKGEAYETMLQQHPRLRQGSTLPPDQAVFLAGYMAHLHLDLVWLRQIVVPFFYEPEDLGDRHFRTLLHFTLLTYLDMQAESRLPETAAAALAAARPHAWAPFIPDPVLCRWRDALVPQLQPGSSSRTVEIYAGRLRITPAQFAQNLRDEQWMAENLFAKIPIDEIEQILQNAISPGFQVIVDYLSLS